MPSLHAQIPSRLTELELIDRLTTTWLGFFELAGEDAERLTLAVREAVANAVQHGNGVDSSEPVLVCYSVDPDAADGCEKLVIEVVDRGEGFDLDSLPDPRAPQNLLKPSGRGILLMRTFMHQVEYSFSGTAGTVVTMRHRLAAEA